MEISYTVDPDITKASTIDARFYYDAAAYAVSSERILARTSQWIGDLGDVVKRGRVLLVDIAQFDAQFLSLGIVIESRTTGSDQPHAGSVSQLRVGQIEVGHWYRRGVAPSGNGG